MKTKYTIKNFRVFDKTGVTVEISPLTFLVGCNSSGKSSIVKSLSLLRTVFTQKFGTQNPVLGKAIDFSVKPNDTLGSFKNVVRSSSRDKVFTLEYEVHSSYINDDVSISLTLGEGNLGNAIITGVKISRLDGSVLISANNESFVYSGNLFSLKEAFKQYLAAVRLRSAVMSMFPKPEEYYAPDIVQRIKDKIESLYQETSLHCDPKYILEVFQDARFRDTVIDLENAELVIDRFVKTGIMTYFSIFDDLKGMSDMNEIRLLLESKILDVSHRDALRKAIEITCNDYLNSGSPDFLSYYRSLEDSELYSSFNLDEFCKVIKKDSFPHFLSSFSMYGQNMISSIEDGYDVHVGYSLVHDTLAFLSGDDPYTKVVYAEEAIGDPMFSHTLHPLYSETFVDYVNKFLSDIFNNDITENLDYISSSRIQVRRMYPMEDRTEFSDAVRRYFDTKTKYMTLNPPIMLAVDNEDGHGTQIVEASSFLPGSFMSKWLKIFKIGDHMSLEMDKNGLGLLLKVYFTENDKKGVLLADMGYGITQLFSILLQIEEMIMSGLYSKFNGKVTTMTTNKLGGRTVLSQYTEEPLKPRTVAIEEPEIHLHPKYQSLLAEMFYEAYKEYNIQFIVETHSEYLLRKIQTLVGASELMPEEVSMVYVEDDSEVKKGASKVRRIPILEDGRLAAPFGPGFYDEAGSLSRELLKLKINQKE